jgi:hypothetical protein
MLAMAGGGYVGTGSGQLVDGYWVPGSLVRMPKESGFHAVHIIHCVGVIKC